MTNKQLNNQTERVQRNVPEYPDDSRYYSLPPKPNTRYMRIDTIWDAIRIIQDLEKAYGDFEYKIRKKEISVPANYRPENICIGVLRYLGKEYITSIYKEAGVAPRDVIFELYMDQNEGHLVRRLERYIGSRKEEVKDDCGGLNDIAHLAFSTLVKITPNLIPDHWGSWGGDLATGMADIHYYNRHYLNTQELSDSVIGAYPGHESRYLRDNGIRLTRVNCNFTDLCDNADSIYLAYEVDRNRHIFYALSNAMEKYYDRLNMRYRFGQYRYDGFNLNSVSAMRNMLILRVASNQPDFGFFDRLKEEATDYEKICACDSLAHYIFEMAR